MNLLIKTNYHVMFRHVLTDITGWISDTIRTL